VSFIGEVEKDAHNRIILRCRVCRCVDGLSLDTWDKAVLMQRKFLQQKEAFGLKRYFFLID
jgi:hypothetical protein